MKYILKIRNIYFVLLLFIVITSCERFKEDCDFVNGYYEFILPFELSPAQETYHIGDTITISSTVSNPVFERKTGNYYTLDDFKFFLITDIYFMDTVAVDYFNADFFEVYVDTADYYRITRYSNGMSDISGQYLFKQNTYSLNFKLIPKKKGHFLLIQGSNISIFGKNQQFEGKCKHLFDDAKVYMNNRSDNNSHLLNEADNDYYKEYLVGDRLNTQYKDFGGYCFKIID